MNKKELWIELDWVYDYLYKDTSIVIPRDKIFINVENILGFIRLNENWYFSRKHRSRRHLQMYLNTQNPKTLIEDLLKSLNNE